jgi:peptide chain release factor 2
VHRLVRISPFDGQKRRQTTFAMFEVIPEVEDDAEVTLNWDEIRVDTYRSSGAGGQHVNKTDSAIRITHIPTNTVVQCQNERSQHKNRDRAMKLLRAKMYEQEMMKRNQERQAQEDAKTDIAWGHQIRSYVLDQSRIKDLRTSVETGNTQAVLDGALDQFIEASLKQGL